MANMLFIVSNFPPEISTGRLEYQLSQHFKQNGHNVTIVTAFPRRYLLTDPRPNRARFLYVEDVDGLRVIRMGPEFPSRDNLSARGLEYFFEFFSFFLGGVVSGKVDVIICSSPPLTLALASYFLGKLKRAPVIVRIGDLHPQELIDMGLIKSELVAQILGRVERFVYRKSDFLTVLTEGYRRHLLGRGAPPHKVSVVPNWGDPDELRRLREPEQQSEKRNHRFTVVYAGTISWFQDLETMIDAASRLRDERSIDFLIVGDGSQKKQLERKMKRLKLRNVRFMPLRPRTEYLHILRTSDVCVVSVNKEVKTTTIPSKLLDIMACGRPVIADVPLGEVSDIVTKANCGIWVQPGNPEGFAEAVLSLYRNPDVVVRLGRNGLDYLEKRFSLSAAAKEYEIIVRKLMKLSKE